jgi:hypothetical protein
MPQFLSGPKPTRRRRLRLRSGVAVPGGFRRHELHSVARFYRIAGHFIAQKVVSSVKGDGAGVGCLGCELETIAAGFEDGSYDAQAPSRFKVDVAGADGLDRGHWGARVGGGTRGQHERQRQAGKPKQRPERPPQATSLPHNAQPARWRPARLRPRPTKVARSPAPGCNRSAAPAPGCECAGTGAPAASRRRPE